MQVTVLGRHMYLEQQLRDAEVPAPRGGAPRAPPRLWPLTTAQQEAFMSYSAFVLHDGLQQLVPVLLPVVQKELEGMALSDSLTVEQVCALLLSLQLAQLVPVLLLVVQKELEGMALSDSLTVEQVCVLLLSFQLSLQLALLSL